MRPDTDNEVVFEPPFADIRRMARAHGKGTASHDEIEWLRDHPVQHTAALASIYLTYSRNVDRSGLPPKVAGLLTLADSLADTAQSASLNPRKDNPR